MTIFMSNTTLINGAYSKGSLAFLTIGAVLGLSACTGVTDGQAGEQLDVRAEEATIQRPSGAPAPRPMDGAAPSKRSEVLSMEPLAEKFPERADEDGCFLTFAYQGYAPETLIWKDEACESLTTRFADRAFLEAYDNWQKLDPSQKEQVLQGPDGRVLYVEGEFTASIYPIGINGLTYEIVVTD